MRLNSAKIGDRFSYIVPSTLNTDGIKSAYDYEVIAAQGENLTCYAFNIDESFVCDKLGKNKGLPKEFTFLRSDEVYEIGAPELADARVKIGLANKIFRAKHFLVREDTIFDIEFLAAFDAFKKRIAK